MKEQFYRFTMALTRIFGSWIFVLISWFISTGFFLFFPARVLTGIHFYRALFPEKKFFYHLWCVWRQYHNFTYVYLDRFLLRDDDTMECAMEGLEYLEEASAGKTGGIILMSHLGNWEVAAHLLRRKGIRLLLYLGEKNKEQIEKMQKKSLIDSGIKVVTVQENSSNPYDILEGMSFLRDGGFVSLTGDRIWRPDQRSVAVPFLGSQANIPETPHLLALLSGKPVFFFFVFRSSGKKYHMKIFAPEYVRASSRAERKDAIYQSAVKYARLLEKTARDYPFEWFHFEPFLDGSLKR